MIPKSRPKKSASDIFKLVEHIDRVKYPVVVVGIRGYYEDSMGKPNENDRGIYDDAIFVVTPNGVTNFNGNTDPSKFRKGHGTGANKGMATLNPDTYYVHQLALHKGEYLALCQRAGKVTVTRDGDPPYRDTGNFGINIHRGGNSTTGSEGCQTLPPTQWNEFIGIVTKFMEFLYPNEWAQFMKDLKAGKNPIFKQVVPYVLVEQ